ncbi:hypothetical protein FOL47_003069 [Perkinsus chesapeaki]|uniref:Uncharacterized protein n=1 Tax=Perkinsus chesapeaki TaxID=330153 RepID=A0A7J6MA00_PERCH|nr:hypothetical protein FOL47_003069 [Perkinsus chesapeaki]
MSRDVPGSNPLRSPADKAHQLSLPQRSSCVFKRRRPHKLRVAAGQYEASGGPRFAACQTPLTVSNTSAKGVFGTAPQLVSFSWSVYLILDGSTWSVKDGQPQGCTLASLTTSDFETCVLMT